LCLWLCKCV